MYSQLVYEGASGHSDYLNPLHIVHAYKVGRFFLSRTQGFSVVSISPSKHLPLNDCQLVK